MHSSDQAALGHTIEAHLEAHLQADTARRFAGLERLYGVQGAAQIRSAHVAVVGIGGVGSWAAEALARSGVGRITLIDFDQVAESNINRQIHAETGTVGMAKVDAMRNRISQINPACQVHCIEEFATPQNWQAMTVGGGFDAVIDACDQVTTKTALAVWARQQAASKTGLLFITVGAAGGKRRAEKVDIADLSATTHDPLLAKLRYTLRRSHGAPRDKRIGVPCVYSTESVAGPDASCAVEDGQMVDQAGSQSDGSLNCHGYGSVVSVTASFGMCAAGWVLDALAKK
jgi:tRNA threonylcarbamoyladenosine dehydratase